MKIDLDVISIQVYFVMRSQVAGMGKIHRIQIIHRIPDCRKNSSKKKPQQKVYGIRSEMMVFNWRENHHLDDI
jgi:hypothetical protein